MEASADDYDTKPIEIDKLLAKMEALLNKGCWGRAVTANDTPQPGIDAGAGPEGGAAISDPYSVSHLRHELRTPINHIIGYSELLLEEGRRPSARQVA